MRKAGLRGVSRRRGFIVTTRRDAKERPAPELVNRKFVATGPNRVGVGDMTYVPTWPASSSWRWCSMSGVIKSKAEARVALLSEGWYNRRRRHSGLGRIAPAEFELRHATQSTSQ